MVAASIRMEATTRSRLATIAGALILFASCSPSTEVHLQDLYDNGSKQLLLGEMDDARRLADEGLRLSSEQQQSPWQWKFKLLQDEVRLIGRQLSAPFPALEEQIPDSPAYAWVRARQRYLRGQHRLIRGDLPKALEAFEGALALAKESATSDVLRDTNVLRGITLQRLGRWDEGDDSLIKAVAEAKAAGDRFREASATLNLGAGYLFRNRFDEALPFF